MTPKIKICGITQERETQILNKLNIDYAGFVLYPPSKRYVTTARAAELAGLLDPGIKKVAVMVSPTAADIKEVEAAGFADIIQIHKDLDSEVLNKIKTEVWRAVNITPKQPAESSQSGPEEIDDDPLKGFSKEQTQKITAVVADAPDFGSGKTFDWEGEKDLKKHLNNKQFVLAGGLNPENVAEGIRIFSPDVVDVSSGVEGDNGKSEEKITAFVRAVRQER